jgi:hypothetical protein
LILTIGDFMKKIVMMKEAVKAKAIEIRLMKKEVKANQRLGTSNPNANQWLLQRLRGYTRHLNLAYGLARGKTIEQMERTSKTPYSQEQIDEILKGFNDLETQSEKVAL